MSAHSAFLSPMSALPPPDGPLGALATDEEVKEELEDTVDDEDWVAPVTLERATELAVGCYKWEH